MIFNEGGMTYDYWLSVISTGCTRWLFAPDGLWKKIHTIIMIVNDCLIGTWSDVQNTLFSEDWIRHGQSSEGGHKEKIVLSRLGIQSYRDVGRLPTFNRIQSRLNTKCSIIWGWQQERNRIQSRLNTEMNHRRTGFELQPSWHHCEWLHISSMKAPMN